MSAYNNQITIIGNVGNDPVKFDANGNTLVKFNVAVKRSTQKDNDAVDWIPCAAWHDLARGILTHISKGDAVIISGTFQVDSKKNDDGSYSKFYNLNVNKIGKQIFGIAKNDSIESDEDVPF